MEESDGDEEEQIGDPDVDDDDDDESSDEERELDMETFDTQTLIKDEKDRKYLESLPELEREAILGERFENLKAEQDMKKALRESKYVVFTLLLCVLRQPVVVSFSLSFSFVHLTLTRQAQTARGKGPG